MDPSRKTRPVVREETRREDRGEGMRKDSRVGRHSQETHLSFLLLLVLLSLPGEVPFQHIVDGDACAEDDGEIERERDHASRATALANVAR